MRPTLVLLCVVVWLYARAVGWTLRGLVDLLPILAIVIALFSGRGRPHSA